MRLEWSVFAQADRDAEFVAHASEDIRALLAELRAMRDAEIGRAHV